ncbi:MAG: glycosyltransferase family 4 protein [Verrucomicrobiota bacterium]|nr:glycosyltransferase family 4 protein [Verrucomicrobiota bacterium]
MEIALIRRRFTLSGGAENYTQRLALGLADRGIKVTIICEDWPVFDERIVIRTLPTCITPIQFADEVQKLMETRSFDFIFSLERVYRCDVYRAGDGVHRAWLNARAEHLGKWYKITDMLNPKNHQLLKIEKELFSPGHTRAITTNSYRIAKELVEIYSYPPDRIHVIYNGVDIKKFSSGKRDDIRRKYNLTDEDFLVLIVGSGCKRKGFIPSVKALSRLPSNAKLMILGKDTHRIPASVSKIPLAKNRLIYCSPTDKPEDYYAAADIFLLPTLYEPFSNACLEAMAAGLPVITTIVNGFAEILTTETGIKLKRSRDPKEIAAAIESLMSREKLARFKAAAAEKITDFTITRNINETMKLIQVTARLRR